MTPCIKLVRSPMVQYFLENFWMIFRMFLMFENGRGMFKFWKNWKILDLGVKI